MNARDLVRSVRTLPPAPRILVRLLEVVRDPDADSDRVVEVLRLDPAMAAEVIRLSNSVRYAPVQPAVSIDEAVARLGFLEIYRLAARVPAAKMFSPAFGSVGLGPGELWEHSIACAIIVDELSARAELPPGEAYTAGLLHDIGKLVLHEVAASKYAEVFARVESAKMPLVDAERAVFGCDHSEVGAALLELWNFPPEIHEAVRWQYNPAGSEEPRFLAGAILLANWVAAAIGYNHGRDVWAMKVDDEVCRLVNLQPTALERLVVEANQRLRAAADLIDSRGT